MNCSVHSIKFLFCEAHLIGAVLPRNKIKEEL